MTGDGGAEEETMTEYDSDPEESKLSLKMRRREASDDEEDEGGVAVGERLEDLSLIGTVDSNGESDDQGAAADYEYDDDEEEYEDCAELAVMSEEVDDIVKAKDGEGDLKKDGDVDGEGEGEGEAEEEKEKKEVEPSAVPTSGAFYMHDDRFRENAAGRNRRGFDGKKLWESKDERKWGHDKFEELNTQDRHCDEGRRSSKGYYRGRGRARDASGGHPRGGRGRRYSGSSSQFVVPKDAKGRGPRKYQPAMKNKIAFHPPHNKQSVRSLENKSHSGSGREAPTVTSNVEHASAFAKRSGSRLSSASPPFYPSGASNKDASLSHKKGVQPGSNNRNMPPSSVDQQFPQPSSDSVVRGKNAIDAPGMNKLCIDDSVSSPVAKSVNNMHMQSSASSSLSPNQLANLRGHGRVVSPTGSAVFQQPQANNQVNKVSPQAAQANHQFSAQTQGLSPLLSKGQQLVQRSVSGAQSSSPPKAGKGTGQGNGRGSLVYGGVQVMGSGGNAGAGHGDPSPGFFPVMQFGDQHPGGIPAVGMAFPGYVAQPNGLGNSEMTWLPVLASAAGTMGAMGPSYYPPYLSVDGNYHPRPTNQTSALPAPGKDGVLSKPNDHVKAHQRPEVANYDFSQRQNKPRRYSEMSFSQ